MRPLAILLGVLVVCGALIAPKIGATRDSVFFVHDRTKSELTDIDGMPVTDMSESARSDAQGRYVKGVLVTIRRPSLSSDAAIGSLLSQRFHGATVEYLVDN